MESAEPVTLGMRLDALLSTMENMPSTQLYGFIVAATVGICWVVLGPGPEGDYEAPKASSSSSSSSTNTSKSTRVSSSSAGPQPRWHIFKIINVLAVLGFVTSVASFLLNSAEIMEQGRLWQFLGGWSVFMCYFFSFFGISLVHQDIHKQEEAEKVEAAMER